MPVPKHHELFLPVLKYVSAHGKVSIHNLTLAMIKEFNLTAEEVTEKISSGMPRIQSNTQWARTYLKQAGLLHSPSRGIVEITESGKKLLSENRESLSTKDLHEFPPFLEFINRKREKKDEVKDSDTSELTGEELIDLGIKKSQNKIEGELLEELQKMNPYSFEEVPLKLLKKLGYGDYEITKRSGDGGIDGIINEDKLGLDKIYVQTKRYADNVIVRERVLRDFLGAMDTNGVNKGIIVTTSDFDDQVKEAVQKSTKKVLLMNGEELVKLMIENNIGVIETEQKPIIKKVDDNFFEEN